jgi:hypothetical protein
LIRDGACRFPRNHNDRFRSAAHVRPRDTQSVSVKIARDNQDAILANGRPLHQAFVSKTAAIEQKVKAE